MWLKMLVILPFVIYLTVLSFKILSHTKFLRNTQIYFFSKPLGVLITRGLSGFFYKMVK